MRLSLNWILSAAALGLSTLAPATEAQETVTPPTGIAAYPQRLSDQPLSIGKGLAEGDLEGSYVFNSAFGFQEVPNIRYGLTDKLELVLLGIRYTVAEDGQYIPGLAIRLQVHDAIWQEQPDSINPYPFLRPGFIIDAKDKLPYHLTAEGHVGYLVSFVTGNYLHGGGPIATANTELQEIVPFSVDFDLQPHGQALPQGHLRLHLRCAAGPDHAGPDRAPRAPGRRLDGQQPLRPARLLPGELVHRRSGLHPASGPRRHLPLVGATCRSTTGRRGAPRPRSPGSCAAC